MTEQTIGTMVQGTMIQRASDMDLLYNENNDPWGNGRRGLYNKLMKELVLRIANHKDTKDLKWCDIGAGGGHVLRGIEFNRDEVCPTDYFQYSGVDMSASAVEDLKKSEFGQNFEVIDLEEYLHDDNNPPIWSDADVISWIEVLYYFGDKRPWKVSFEEFWKGVKPGAIVVVADSLIPYQYRDYLKTHTDAELLESYTDQTEKVSTVTRENGSTWTRWLKVRVFRKL